MAAGTAERNAVAVRTDAAENDPARLAAIDGNQGVDFRCAVTKQMFDAAQVTESLLTDVADKEYIGVGFYPGLLQRAQHAEDGHQAARVVTDAGRIHFLVIEAHRNLGTGWKHGVQVSAVGDDPLTNLAGPPPDNIADFIDRHIIQSGFPQHFGKSLRALFFAERRRRNFGQFDQVAPRLRFDRNNVFHCSLHVAIIGEGCNFRSEFRSHFIIQPFHGGQRFANCQQNDCQYFVFCELRGSICFHL